MPAYLMAIILLTVGLISLIIEVIVPGFGIPGIIGIGCVGVAAVITITSVPFGIFYVCGGAVMLVICFYALFRFMRAKQAYGDLILKDTLKNEVEDVGDLDKLIGKDGIVKVPLKPFGAAEFNGISMDVYSDGVFVPKGRTVRVINVENNKIIVKEMN